MAKEPTAFQMERAMSALLQARQALLEADPSIQDDEKLFLDTLEGESGDAMDLLHRLLQSAVQAADYADMLKERAKRMLDRAGRWQVRSVALRQGALNAMEALELPQQRLTFDDLTASIQKGRMRVHVSDIDGLAERFVRTTKEPRLTEIREALDKGEDVPQATLSNAPPSLRISST